MEESNNDQIKNGFQLENSLQEDFSSFNKGSLGEGIEALIPKKEAKKDNAQDLEKRIEENVKEIPENFSHLFNGPENQKQLKEEKLLEKEYFSDQKNRQDLTEGLTEEKKLEDINALLEEKVFYIETDKIKPNPLQPRKVFSEESIDELAQSIREYGILEPLVVTRVEKETEKGTTVEYQLISGERRLLASKKLGLPTVPVIIRKPIEERRKLELALIENIQREDLDPISKAQAFYKLINDFSLTQQELADRLGKSRELVANTLRLLQLPLEAQNALREGKINEAHARAILFFTHPDKRRAFLKEILAKNLSGREALEIAQHLTSSKEKASRRKNISLEPQDLEIKERLEEILETPVYIKKKGEQGAIEIKFYSSEDLEKILKKILKD
ncbi:MAG: ParB/RepB/Spo0J family partition protein [Candidatus Paceibacterota bacterium]